MASVTSCDDLMRRADILTSNLVYSYVDQIVNSFGVSWGFHYGGLQLDDGEEICDEAEIEEEAYDEAG